MQVLRANRRKGERELILFSEKKNFSRSPLLLFDLGSEGRVTVNVVDWWQGVETTSGDRNETRN
jgi:hypothetical protein